MQDLKARTERVALAVILCLREHYRGVELKFIKCQPTRPAVSVAAPYRSARRAKSRVDFTSKLGTAEAQPGGSQAWLECLTELAARPHAELHCLLNDAGELTALLIATRKSARSHGV